MKKNAKRKVRSSSLLLALLVSVSTMLAFASIASAEATFDYAFGSAGSGGGQFNEPGAISQNLSTGDLYVADRQNNRIQQFTESGEFLQAWGFDVVESGFDNKPFVDEVQRVTIRGVDGTFTLNYGGDTTTPLAYNASPATVETALNALPSISGAGSVTVSGGPGDANGTNPYLITFSGGGLAQGDQIDLTVDRSQLARAVGTELGCAGVDYYVSIEGTFFYQWLREWPADFRSDLLDLHDFSCGLREGGPVPGRRALGTVRTLSGRPGNESRLHDHRLGAYARAAPATGGNRRTQRGQRRSHLRAS